MAKKKRKPIRRKPQPVESREERNEVVLKPFLGVSPGLYLTILYAMLILFILFMLLFFKGLRDKGEYLHVTTFPPGASVQVDGRYVGSSPCEVLVKQGDRTVTVSKPHFARVILEDTFRSPVFGTLFVRPRRDLTIDLELTDAEGLARHGLEDFAANPHIPEILMETIWGGHNSPSGTEELYFFIDKSKYFVTNSLQLHSYLYALSALEANVGAMTPTSLLSTVNKIVQLNQKYENFPFWLAVVLKDEAAQRVVGTPWFTEAVADYRRRYEQLRVQAAETPQSGGGNAVTVQGLRFVAVREGELLQGDGPDGFASVQLPHPVSVPSFLMSEVEVSNRLFQTFVTENPDWAPGNISSLFKRGLVDDQYLSTWPNADNRADWEELPVTGVSFYAAQAFCQWLTSRLPPAYSDYSARLPFESEWEWASRGGLLGADYPTGRPSAEDNFYSPDSDGPSPVGISARNDYGLQDMMGNVWEWCLDWYSPVKYLFTSMDSENNDFDSTRELPFGTEKVIRGGSWANEQELIKVSTRGSQPPDWCTPYLGFRVVLSRYVP
jgi:iron(II)-dependent oxidoreductase